MLATGVGAAATRVRGGDAGAVSPPGTMERGALEPAGGGGALAAALTLGAGCGRGAVRAAGGAPGVGEAEAGAGAASEAPV